MRLAALPKCARNADEAHHHDEDDEDDHDAGCQDAALAHSLAGAGEREGEHDVADHAPDGKPTADSCSHGRCR